MASTNGCIAASETAQDVAAAFTKFQDAVPGARSEITAIVSELFAISSALSELDTALHDPRYVRYRDAVSDHKYVALRSIVYTFADVKRLFGGLRRAAWQGDREAYQTVWQDVCEFFLAESRNTFVRRLEYYRLFLLETVRAAQGHDGNRTLRDLHDKVDALLKVQMEKNRLDSGLNELTVGDREPSRKPSWERRRPSSNLPSPHLQHSRSRSRSRHRPQPPPIIPVRSPGMARPSRYTPLHSPLSPNQGFHDYGFPPMAPDVPPLSPTTTAATTMSTTTDTSSAGAPPDPHWITAAFGLSRPNTKFRLHGTPSDCFGANKPDAWQLLKREYDDYLALPFDNSLQVRILIRPTDRRTRILCRKTLHGQQRYQSCEVATSLKISRLNSCLLLSIPRKKNQYDQWLNLRFDSYERMVLFFCTFLALKAQAEKNTITSLDDHVLDQEELKFSAIIHDSSYRHVLRILMDHDSGGVRLEASVHSGPMKKAPVWTAFINYKIMSRRWTTKTGPYTVQLGELTRHVFDYDYEPLLGPNGEHELRFLYPQDTDEFLYRIDQVANEVADHFS